MVLPDMVPLQVGKQSNRAALQRLERTRVEHEPWRQDRPAVSRPCAPPCTAALRLSRVLNKFAAPRALLARG